MCVPDEVDGVCGDEEVVGVAAVQRQKALICLHSIVHEVVRLQPVRQRHLANMKFLTKSQGMKHRRQTSIAGKQMEQL